MCISICEILVDLCDDVCVAPIVTASTDKRDDMTTFKTITMASPTCEVSMYFVFVTLKKIYSFLVDSLHFSVNDLMVATSSLSTELVALGKFSWPLIYEALVLRLL